MPTLTITWDDDSDTTTGEQAEHLTADVLEMIASGCTSGHLAEPAGYFELNDTSRPILSSDEHAIVARVMAQYAAQHPENPAASYVERETARQIAAIAKSLNNAR